MYSFDDGQKNWEMKNSKEARDIDEIAPLRVDISPFIRNFTER